MPVLPQHLPLQPGNWNPLNDFLSIGHNADGTLKNTQGVFNIKDEAYGAKGDDSNDSTPIQAAIDACSAAGGGIVICPVPTVDYKCNVVLKQGVILMGVETRTSPWTPALVKFTANAAGYVIDTPAGSTAGCGVVGIGIHGLGAGTAGGGVRFQNVSRGRIEHVVCNNFADEGVLVSAGVACEIGRIFAQNCVLNRSRAAPIGAVDVNGTDHWVSHIEATTSSSIEGTVSSVNLYCAGIVIRMANGFCESLIGEISDIGIHVTGSLNRFSSCRGDLNYGHGFYIPGSSNAFTTCLGLNNSQDTTNTYDNWQFTAASGKNSTSGCVAVSSVAKVARYGFNDLVASATAKNSHSNPVSFGAGTQQFQSSGSSASAFHFPSGSAKSLTANSTTPDVSGYGFFATANSSPTTVTDFTGGVDGQRIILWCNDVNTSIQHNGSTIVTFNGGNVKLVSGRIYALTRHGSWKLESFGEPPQVSADNGDAAKTLQARVSESTQKWATALTANRAVALSATGAYNGARFHIVRTAAATGASTLDVGTGPLKSLAVGQWCDVEYDGSNWILTAFGSL